MDERADMKTGQVEHSKFLPGDDYDPLADWFNIPQSVEDMMNLQKAGFEVISAEGGVYRVRSKKWREEQLNRFNQLRGSSQRRNKH